MSQKTTQADWSILVGEDTIAEMATVAASLLDAETFSASSERVIQRSSARELDPGSLVMPAHGPHGHYHSRPMRREGPRREGPREGPPVWIMYNTQIVRERKIAAEQYYRSHGDHAPPHAHIIGGGAETRIGQQLAPLGGDPVITAAQREFIAQNRSAIRKAIDQIGRWFRFNRQQ